MKYKVGDLLSHRDRSVIYYGDNYSKGEERVFLVIKIIPGAYYLMDSCERDARVFGRFYVDGFFERLA